MWHQSCSISSKQGSLPPYSHSIFRTSPHVNPATTAPNATTKATTQATRKGAKTVSKHASKGGRHAWSGEYVGGFSSHVTHGATTVGEIGNKAKPGLVHLLEKGHATLTGRRTGAFPHMAPAFTEISADFVERAEREIGRAIS